MAPFKKQHFLAIFLKRKSVLNNLFISRTKAGYRGGVPQPKNAEKAQTLCCQPQSGKSIDDYSSKMIENQQKTCDIDKHNHITNTKTRNPRRMNELH